MVYKIIITTSGTGSRLKELTKNTNKALIEINGRETIEYILDKYDKSIPLVVTIGYLAEQIKEYLETRHRDRNISFVKIAPYEGPGSSLGYSLLQAEPFVKCPFVFHACDTIVMENIPVPNHNWAAAYPVASNQDVNQYRTHKKDGSRLVQINDKGVLGYNAIHIGLTGIFDYQSFWKNLRALYEQRSKEDTSLSDVHVIEAMLKEGIQFESIDLPSWLDTGNIEALNQTIATLKKSQSI